AKMNAWSSLRLGCRAVRTAVRQPYNAATGRVVAAGNFATVNNDFVRHQSTQEQNIIKSPYKSISVPDVSLPDFVWEMVDTIPDQIALSCAVTGREYTYAEARAIARRFAASLLKAGFKPGDTLAIVLPNLPEFPILLLGAVECGIIVTTVNPAFTAGEIEKQLRNSGAIGVVTIPEVYPNVAKALSVLEPERKSKIPVIISPGIEDNSIPQGTINLQEMIHKDIDVSNLHSNHKLNPDDVVVLPYSSGTTGLPKGVMLSHRNLVTNCLQICSEPKLVGAERATSDFQEVLPALLPFYHIYGLLGLAIASLNFGMKIVTVPKFEPAHFIKTIVQYKATVLYLVPPLIQFMGAHPDVKAEYFNSVKFINNGAAPAGPNDIERLLKKAPQVRFGQGYGLTETSPVVCVSEKGSKKYTSSGRPIPNTEMKVINRDTGENLGIGQPGEICIRGPQVMLGYHNNPQATAETIDSSGWLHTGDMGYYDEEKDFYILDRYKELIKVKGLQVAPAELEDLLRSHPLVADAAVIGIPDERSGEVPKAFIVAKDQKLTEEDLKKFVAEKVSEHKHLAGGVQFISAIPKNPSGKILRRQLKETYSK
ncbi:hypothetical protein ANN_05934, partial [Periplaneta americana]